MTELLVTATWKAGVALLAAWLASALLRRSSADLRHRIWLAALAAVALVWIPAPVPDGIRITVETSLDPVGNAGAPSRDFAWLILLWAAGAAAVLLRMACGLVRLAHITRSARPALSDGIRISDSVLSPLTWGAVILLPAYVLDWSEEQRELVIRHERAHIARRDWLWQTFAQAVCAALWFHPLVWLAVAKLREEAEQAVDDAMIAGGADAAEYAGQLVAVARRLSGNVPAGATAMVRNAALSARVAAILDGTRVRQASTGRVRIAIAAGAACAVLLLAACQKNQIYRIGPGITAPKLQKKVEPDYTQEARAARKEGTVVLTMIISRQGRAENIRVVKSLEPGLDKRAVEAAQQWSFEPATRNGKPVRVEATVEVNFKLM
jgi:TonB family protein